MRMRTYLTLGGSILTIGLSAVLLINGQQQQQPEHNMSHQQMEEMNKRGDHAMGFDHSKTTHHFILASDGGSIEIAANDKEDIASRDQIRGHLPHITRMFSEGNFDVPMLIHAETPPGTEVMQKLKAVIKYQYKESERGGLIRISTSDPEALRAVHEFLRYQIKEHVTGDPLEPPSASKAS